MRIGLLAPFCVLGWLMVANDAQSTSPIGNVLSKIWKQTTEGEVIYAHAVEANLLSLCIEVDGVGNWLPSSLLEDVSYPKLEEVELWHGMGLERVDEFLPNWGNWGLSVEVESEIEIDGKFEEGPTYYFVLDENKSVAYRMTRVWVPLEEPPGAKQSQVQWLKIQPHEIRRAPCWPTP